MKTSPATAGRMRPRAFTLIELLVVIAIIALLAALTMGTFTFAQQAASRNRTTAGLSAIVNALEQYKEKFGEYPEAADPAILGSGSNASVRIGGALMLYQAITGDGFDHVAGADKSAPTGAPVSDGSVDPNEQPNAIRSDLPRTMIVNTSSGYMLVDGFGRPYQYDKGGSATAINTTFDVWSFAQSQPIENVSAELKRDDRATATWIKNW